jgi:phosphohistidine swiveling domain-containing protein
VQIVPVLLGIVGAAGAWLGRRLWRLLGGHKNPRRPLTVMAWVFGVGWLLTATVAVLALSRAHELASSLNLAQMLRCSVSFHEHRAERTRELEAGMLLPRIKVGELSRELEERFARDPGYKPLLVSMLNTRTSYDSGFLGFGPPEHRRYFDYVPPKEMTTYLRQIPASERASRDVIVESLSVNEHEISGLVDTLQEFRSVRFVERFPAVRSRGKEAEYGRAGPGMSPTLFVREDDGRIRPAVYLPPEKRNWPVPVFKVNFDEAHVLGPRMTELLSFDAVRAHVLRTPVVFTFGGGYVADPGVAAEFAFALFNLRLADSDRAIDTRNPGSSAHMVAALRRADVFLFDILDSDEARIKEIVEAVGDRPFLIVPISAMDFPLSSDVPRAVEREARAKGRPFRYLGSTLQMPEAVAQAELARKSVSATAVLRDRTRRVFAAAIARVGRAVSSTGAALVLLGIAARLLFLPALVNARRVKRTRGLISKWKREYLTRLHSARRHLRIGPLYEVPGALANLLFLVPFFAAPTAMLTGRQFLWISDLGKPDPWVASALGILFGSLAALMVAGASGRRTVITFLVSAVGLLVAAALAVPSGIGLYACGGLLITMIAEVIAAHAAHGVAGALSLRVPTRSASATGGCVPLTDCVDLEEVGAKAALLGKLAIASQSTDLFVVPPGVVFRDFESLGISKVDDFEQTVRAQLRARLPNAETTAFAVRSSAPGEDGVNESQAGRYVSVLNVPFAEVPQALRRVLASYGDEATRRNFRVGVIVQAMAPAHFAGVMFTRSPSNGGLTHINYTQGLGDRLVSGEATATELFVGRRSGVVRPLDGEVRLGERLFLAGAAVEELFGRAQDIEWAYDKAADTLYLLQSRPVTAVEYDPAVLAEQERHMLSVDALSAGDDGTRVLWKRSDVREVVENPSNFAASIIQRAYAPGGSIVIASRQLGLHIPGMDVVSLFGQLYERTGAGLMSSIRFVFGSWRMRRRLPKTDWPAKLRAEADRALPRVELDAPDARELSRQIVAHVLAFIQDVYPVAAKATILAKIAQPKEPPKVHTIAADIFEELARAAETGDVRAFAESWGYRSERDYDPAAPDFGEDLEALQCYVAGFRGVPVPQKVGTDESSTYAQLVQLKEKTKDRAVRYLRSLRPAMLRLASLLGVAQESIFVLSVESLAAFAAGNCAEVDLVREIHAGARPETARKAISLGDQVSLADLEFLGALRDTPTNEATSARFVATKRAFSGKVQHLSLLSPGEDFAGAILVTDMLQPSLVRFFGHVSGIISERGAYLSHAAIVGREAGVPILVLPRALSTLAQGTVVSVTEGGAVSCG